MKKGLIVLVAIGLVVLVGGCIIQSGNEETHKIENNYTSLEISDPSQGETVSQHIQINGNVRPLNSTEKLYILIKPDGYNWWIQMEPTIYSDGLWDCSVQIGEEGDNGMDFEICAIISTENLTYQSEFGPDLPVYALKDEIVVKR